MKEIQGLYQKYKSIERTDGREVNVADCFVLDIKDTNARKAMLSYAFELDNSKEGDKILAKDLRSWVHNHESREESPLMKALLNLIENDFSDSPYTDFNRYWIEHMDHYDKLLGSQFKSVFVKLGNRKLN